MDNTAHIDDAPADNEMALVPVERFNHRAQQDKPPCMRELSPQQRLFVMYYCGESRFNATDAARRAGYADPGMQAYRLKRNAVIMAIVEATLEAECLSQVEVLHELAKTAMAPTEHFAQVIRPPMVDQNGNQYDAIVRLDYGAKMKALELVGKHFKMFTDNVNMSGGATVVVREYREGDPQLRDKNDSEGGGI